MQLAAKPATTETPTAVIRRWSCRDNIYAIVEIRSTLGLGVRYLATKRRDNGNETIVSRNRKRQAAIRALLKVERADIRRQKEHDRQEREREAAKAARRAGKSARRRKQQQYLSFHTEGEK